MPRCIVLEPCKNSLEKVKPFGEIFYLFPPSIRRAAIFDFRQFALDIGDRLQEVGYDPDNDIIVLAGGMVAMSSFIAVVAGEWGCKIPILAYNANKDEYFESCLGLEFETAV
jgi:hypothetical protein